MGTLRVINWCWVLLLCPLCPADNTIIQHYTNRPSPSGQYYLHHGCLLSSPHVFDVLISICQETGDSHPVPSYHDEHSPRFNITYFLRQLLPRWLDILRRLLLLDVHGEHELPDGPAGEGPHSHPDPDSVLSSAGTKEDIWSRSSRPSNNSL